MDLDVDLGRAADDQSGGTRVADAVQQLDDAAGPMDTDTQDQRPGRNRHVVDRGEDGDVLEELGFAHGARLMAQQRPAQALKHRGDGVTFEHGTPPGHQGYVGDATTL